MSVLRIITPPSCMKTLFYVLAGFIPTRRCPGFTYKIMYAVLLQQHRNVLWFTHICGCAVGSGVCFVMVGGFRDSLWKPPPELLGRITGYCVQVWASPLCRMAVHRERSSCFRATVGSRSRVGPQWHLVEDTVCVYTVLYVWTCISAGLFSVLESLYILL